MTDSNMVQQLAAWWQMHATGKANTLLRGAALLCLTDSDPSTGVGTSPGAPLTSLPPLTITCLSDQLWVSTVLQDKA